MAGLPLPQGPKAQGGGPGRGKSEPAPRSILLSCAPDADADASSSSSSYAYASSSSYASATGLSRPFTCAGGQVASTAVNRSRILYWCFAPFGTTYESPGAR